MPAADTLAVPMPDDGTLAVPLSDGDDHLTYHLYTCHYVWLSQLLYTCMYQLFQGLVPRSQLHGIPAVHLTEVCYGSSEPIVGVCR